jgi:hypothetical protein
MKKAFFLAMSVFALATISSCKKEEEETITPTPTATTGSVTLEMEHMFNDLEFALGTEYTTAAGEIVSFNTTKYYVSNIKFTKTDGSVFTQSESYYLVDLSADGSNLLTISDVPTGDYTDITFTIGVDSTRNVSGAQSGALSVANGMFWSWNSGYIFAKLEGDCPQSSNGTFTYHLGGFTGDNSALNTGTFSFDPAIMSVSPTATPQIHMSVNIAQVFDNVDSPLLVATSSNVQMPGTTSHDIAVNFFSGIEFEHVHN